jgi:hypothetical protein
MVHALAVRFLYQCLYLKIVFFLLYEIGLAHIEYQDGAGIIGGKVRHVAVFYLLEVISPH